MTMSRSPVSFTLTDPVREDDEEPAQLAYLERVATQEVGQVFQGQAGKHRPVSVGEATSELGRSTLHGQARDRRVGGRRRRPLIGAAGDESCGQHGRARRSTRSHRQGLQQGLWRRLLVPQHTPILAGNRHPSAAVPERAGALESP